MSLPVVAIVGRPNVGKSSLFNMLAGRRISIVEPTAGVTRDRVGSVIDHNDRYFELVDTGGIGVVDVDDLSADVDKQIQYALDSATVIVFVVDIRTGVMPLDQTVAARLRTLNKPILFVGNKADEPIIDVQAPELYRLGYGEPLLVSANSKRGRDELLDAVLTHIPADADNTAPTDVDLKLAIVGRRNVGKSTFINALAESERVIVSEVPGTTRDSVDVRFVRDGKSYLAIDTAGVRKKTKLADDIEFYSAHRAERSIRRADVVMHFFDARVRVGRVDKQLAEYVINEHKPSIFVVNKWDLVKDSMETGRMADYLRKVFPMLDYVPIAFVTAKTGKNALRLLHLAGQLHHQAGKRISTGKLNQLLKAATDFNAPPVRANKVGKIYYAAQIGTLPPTIALVTNGPETFDNTYLKYLTKVMRDKGPFGEVPLKIVVRAKGEGGLGGGRPGQATTEEIAALVAEPVIEEVAVPQVKKKVRKPRPAKARPAPGTWDV